jgi:hypothetical protein
MRNIRTTFLAVCIGALGSLALQAQDECHPQSVSDLCLGYHALYRITTGLDDTAVGSESLTYDTTGSDNSAFGYGTLHLNVSGYRNSAAGSMALHSNTADDNSALGAQSLRDSTSGAGNTAAGVRALENNTSGSDNMALGYQALDHNTTGSENIGIGHSAGANLPIGANDNIDIGSPGSTADYGYIRIGNPDTQKYFYAAGVYQQTVTNNPVLAAISSDNQLGITTSSIRFKEDVHDMAAASDGLMRLRPVTFRYKQPYADGSKPINYGLIAEEVAQVYPELVVRDADGQIQTVQYQKLTPMLLNEVQKDHRLLERQEKTIEEQENSHAQREETIQALEKQLAALSLLEKRLAALGAAQPSATMLETRLETK